MKMWRYLGCLALAAGFCGQSAEAANVYGLKPGAVTLQSVGALTFGPDGVLFVGDPLAAKVYALETKDTAPQEKVTYDIQNLQAALKQAVQAENGASVTITDLAVNPETGHVYLAASTGKQSAALLKVSSDGKLSQVDLSNIAHATAAIPNPAENKEIQSPRGPRNNRSSAITDLAFFEGQLIVSGLSNQQAASTVWSVAFPFSEFNQGAPIEIYHAAHGRAENNAPIRTFVPFIINGEPNLLAGYVCTPLVKFPLSELTKAGQEVRGTTVAELGNRNQPLDMIAYEKDGQNFLLLSNSARGVMKISTEGIDRADGLTEPVSGGGTQGQPFDTIDDWKGVIQMDKLDARRAVVVLQDGETLSLRTLPLP